MMLRASLIAASVALASVGQVTAGLVYSNGPINGQTDNLPINNGYVLTDSFIVSAPTNLATAQIGLWLYPGDLPTSVNWSIGTFAFGSDVSSGDSDLSNVFVGRNAPGYDIYESTFSLSGVLTSGTYWLTLQNATSMDGSYVFWDVNFGPSMAVDSYYGSSFGSESFQLYGASVATPAPASLSLLSIGIVVIVGYSWRHRHRPMPA
jgi:hypothetical protein